MKKILSLLVVLAVFLSCGVSAKATVVMDWVTIGDTGNVADVHGDGYGRVDSIYQIGKYEVTTGQYTKFLNAVAAADTYGLYNTDMWANEYGCKIERSGSAGSYNYSVASDYANRPVNYVSFWDASRFANWLHNGQRTGIQDNTTTEDGAYTLTSDGISNNTVTRNPDAVIFVPTENEWYKAAYYDGDTAIYYDYPTGTDSVPSNVLIEPDPGNNANFYQDGYTIGSPYWRTEVGEFENSASPYGIFDQGGNVWEWNETITDLPYRGIRGGAFNYVGNLQASSRYSTDPTFELDNFGFRVAQVPEPCTIILIALGGLALRKRK